MAESVQIQATLNRPQFEYLTLNKKYNLYVGGFGSGKTFSGALSTCGFAWTNPGLLQGYFGPSYPTIRDVYYPTIDEAAHLCGLRAVVRRGVHEVDLFNGRQYRSTIICRSMDRPETIVGFKIARAHVDEIDTVAKVRAETAWRNIKARLRLVYDGVNDANITTTPEGFGFAYDHFIKQPRDDASIRALTGVVQASTYENEIHLPGDYISSLKTTYASNQIEAYLLGKFVNLAHGTVYHQFDRKLNGSSETVQKNDILHIGMDFNVGKMTAITHVTRKGEPHAVDEITKGYDTPDMTRQIQERYWTYIDGRYQKTHQIRVYPDSSGGSRKSVDASTTDIQLLKAAGFTVHAPAANPPVKDRVNAFNAMICNGNNERRYHVNAEKCPTLVDSLEQQAYNDVGEPDKSNDLDHPPDAAGYYVHNQFPLIKPVTRINIGRAI